MTHSHHEPVIGASKSTSSPGQGPAIVIIGSCVPLLSFTLDTDDAYRQFKVPNTYLGTPTVHVHWTKTGNADESGKTVKWKITALCFDGDGGLASSGATSVEYEDTYEDSGTTTRIMYRTPNLALPTLTVGWYVGLKIEAVTPAGTPMASEPGLFSVDLMYTEYMNIHQ